jgi:hypothetical protein
MIFLAVIKIHMKIFVLCGFYFVSLFLSSGCHQCWTGQGLCPLVNRVNSLLVPQKVENFSTSSEKHLNSSTVSYLKKLGNYKKKKIQTNAAHIITPYFLPFILVLFSCLCKVFHVVSSHCFPT